MQAIKLTRKQVNEYHHKYLQGDKDAIVPIVLDTAIIFSHKCKGRVPRDECISICYEIVLGAIDRYDSSFGATFSTYLFGAVFTGLVKYFRSYNKVYRHEFMVWTDDEELKEAPNEIENMYADKLHEVRELCLVVAKENKNKNVLKTIELFLQGYKFIEIEPILGVSHQAIAMYFKSVIKEAKKRVQNKEVENGKAYTGTTRER
jgi:hypothetical protein